MRGPSPIRKIHPVQISVHPVIKEPQECRIKKCVNMSVMNGDVCDYHTARNSKYNSYCTICDKSTENLRSGDCLDSMVRHYDKHVCNHWFCTRCIDRYEFTYCPRCGRNIENLVDLLNS
jgi:hypothetical protein